MSIDHTILYYHANIFSNLETGKQLTISSQNLKYERTWKLGPGKIWSRTRWLHLPTWRTNRKLILRTGMPRRRLWSLNRVIVPTAWSSSRPWKPVGNARGVPIAPWSAKEKTGSLLAVAKATRYGLHLEFAVRLFVNIRVPFDFFCETVNLAITHKFLRGLIKKNGRPGVEQGFCAVFYIEFVCSPCALLQFASTIL